MTLMKRDRRLISASGYRPLMTPDKENSLAPW